MNFITKGLTGMRRRGRIGLTWAVVLFIGLATSCGTGQETGGGTMDYEKPAEWMEGGMTELPFKHVPLEDTPESVQKWIETNQSQEQKQVLHADGKTYVIITLGQKRTGGYEVKITQIAEIEGTDTISVTHEVTEPEEGEMATQVITYPLAIAEMDGEWDQSFQFTTN